MAEEPSSYYAQVDWCEAAIGRIRAALRAGEGDNDAVQQDLARIQAFAARRFDYCASKAARYGPGAADEALELMLDQLVDDSIEHRVAALLTRPGVRG